MKKLLSLIVVSILWCNISLAQEFYPNKELDINELINFDLTKYKFTDYKKIIGSKVKSWEGNTQQLSKNVKNYKSANYQREFLNALSKITSIYVYGPGHSYFDQRFVL